MIADRRIVFNLEYRSSDPHSFVTIRFAELIAESPDGLNGIAAFTKLFAQRHDMHINRAIQNGNIPSQGAVDDGAARLHKAGMRGQELQEAILRCSKINDSIAAAHFVA